MLDVWFAQGTKRTSLHLSSPPHSLLTKPTQDVDMVVLTNSYEQEDIKEIIVYADPKFFLVKPRTPGATYKILYYTLNSGGYCKVDILLPGILDIPFVPASQIVYTHVPDVPVMPLVAVILLKLQGWTDHRDSDRDDFQEKQHVDIDDIWDMLYIWVRGHSDETVHTERWMPYEFVEAAKGRVEEFIEECPDSEDHWRLMGFNIQQVVRLGYLSTNSDWY